ncbi:hypothetical protein LNTAR_14947 [Lentisphaera araneosa HTCC2155]|uniref:Uncharacterized protein n=1 Tax=Lentisphaera araneosa HTCC2155 TaxID=313628 RepID=A6DHP1_9BACT|nr:site-specific integrase [Lentisphaera araneosa]EDM29124.1 hypothetical protein LNTAR_14947 [Lentisphaera araneosa HTCC2155]
MTRKRTAHIEKKGKTYYARFYNYLDQRVKKSLKTKSADTAQQVVAELDKFISLQLTALQAQKTDISDLVYELYYGEKLLKPLSAKTKKLLSEFPDIDIADKDIHKLADQILKLGEELSTHEEKITLLEKENAELIKFKEKYFSLSNSVEGKISLSYQNSPTCRDALVIYEQDLSREIAKKDVSTHINKLNDFFKHHDLLDNKLSVVTPVYLTEYLDDESDSFKEPNRRFNRVWKYFSRFFNYASRTWEIDNIAARVKKRKNEQRGDIHWHPIEEIEAVLIKQDTYWQALIGTLGFAGCSAHEMRGLKRDDFYKGSDGDYYLRVQANEIRTLKNAKRARSIHVNPNHLLPLLLSHVKELATGDLLFPSRVTGSPHWQAGSLSVYLNGRNARGPTAAVIGVLPAEMTALSLRRAYGSNMLRSGKTASEVAAAMGNSSRMVEDHYARLLAVEVKSDF